MFALRRAPSLARPQWKAATISRRGLSRKDAQPPTTGIFHWYNQSLEKNPILTKSLTSGVIALAGDVSCQIAVEKVENVNMKRAAIFSLLGGALVGPTLHFWYSFLHKVLPAANSMGAMGRLGLDQFVFAPVFIGTFLSSLLSLEHVSGNEAETALQEKIQTKLQTDWWPAVQINWLMWIPAQFVNFRFIPGKYQVLFANVVGVFWNTYLSHAAHNSSEVEN